MIGFSWCNIQVDYLRPVIPFPEPERSVSGHASSVVLFEMAGILTDTSRETPVFLRFSTVLGSRGSADTVRDVRGFAVKFYTEEGNWDIVGNNIPVFFIQDSMKFVSNGLVQTSFPHCEILTYSARCHSRWKAGA